MGYSPFHLLLQKKGYSLLRQRLYHFMMSYIEFCYIFFLFLWNSDCLLLYQVGIAGKCNESLFYIIAWMNLVKIKQCFSLNSKISNYKFIIQYVSSTREILYTKCQRKFFGLYVLCLYHLTKICSKLLTLNVRPPTGSVFFQWMQEKQNME